MSPLSPEQILSPDITLRAKVVSWLVQQGISAVLLVSAGCAVYFSRTEIIGAIQSGYDRNAASLEKAVQAMERQSDRMAKHAEEDRRMLIQVLQDRRVDKADSEK